MVQCSNKQYYTELVSIVGNNIVMMPQHPLNKLAAIIHITLIYTV